MENNILVIAEQHSTIPAAETCGLPNGDLVCLPFLVTMFTFWQSTSATFCRLLFCMSNENMTRKSNIGKPPIGIIGYITNKTSYFN